MTFEVACFGGAHIDLIAQAGGELVMATSNPGVVRSKPGGVALNVACALNDLGRRVALVSSLGADSDGDLIAATLSARDIDTSRLHRSTDFATGRYVAIEDVDGELSLAVSDTAALDNLEAARLETSLQALSDAGYWFADANLPPALLAVMAKHPERPGLVVDAVSVAKALRLRDLLDEIDLLFCNVAEAASLVGPHPDPLKALAKAGVRSCVVTNGAGPVGVFDGADCHEIAVPAVAVSSVTGAGDTLVAGTMDGLLSGAALAEAASRGIQAAGRKLTS
jgi:pseudouridine kinase